MVDAEFGIAELQAAGVARYVVRLATNATARRNQLPAYKGRGRPPSMAKKCVHWLASGKSVRLPRRHPTNKVNSTTRNDCIQSQRSGIDLVERSDTADADRTQTFSIYVYHDPLYKQPLVLATNLQLGST